MKYNKILFLIGLIIIIILVGTNTEFYNNPQLFLVRLNYQNNYQMYNLYDSTDRYKSYCDFIKDFNFIMKHNKFNKFNKNISFKEFKHKIKKYVFLNDILIKKNNETVQCEREYFYKVKYFIPTMNHKYITDGFYIFLFVLFLKYKFDNNESILQDINQELNKNKLNIKITDISGNVFIKMRDIIFTKEVCYPEKIAGIRPDFLVKNDLQKRIDRRNPFKYFPKVIELKLENNKFKLTNIEDEFYYPRHKTEHQKQRLNAYLNTPDFKRRVFINTVNTVNDIYMDKTLNNILTIPEFKKELVNAKSQFEQQFNNQLDCNTFNRKSNSKECHSDMGFNSARKFTDKIFECGDGRIIISLKNEQKKTGNTIDVNRLHYALCPTVINGKLVGKMDYYNENCSINDIEPEYIFSKKSAYTELPFNYWLFKDRE